jgi:hypothetical protein
MLMTFQEGISMVSPVYHIYVILLRAVYVLFYTVLFYVLHPLSIFFIFSIVIVNCKCRHLQ